MTLWKAYLSEMGWCFTVLNLRGDEECTVLFLNQNNQGFFGHLRRDTLEIKLFMEVQEEGMGVEEEFVHKIMGAFSNINYF